MPIKDSKAIAIGVRELYNKPELVKQMVAINLEKIANELSSETTADNYIKYFEQLIIADQ